MTGWRCIFPRRAINKLISVGHGGASIITMRNGFDEISLYHAMPIFRIIRSLVSCHTKRNTRSNQSDNKNVTHLIFSPRVIRSVFPSDIEYFRSICPAWVIKCHFSPLPIIDTDKISNIIVRCVITGTSISTVTVIVFIRCYSVIQKISCRNSVCEIDSCHAVIVINDTAFTS